MVTRSKAARSRDLGSGMTVAIVAGMTADTIKMPAAPRQIPALDPEDEKWLRSLAPHYARAFEGAIDVQGLVARARRLALRIEKSAPWDSARAARLKHEADLDRGADILEQVDAQRAKLLADKREALSPLNPDQRTLVLRRASDLIAVIDHLPKLAGFEEASSWMAALSSEVARALAIVVVIEQRLDPIEELRRRAYHALDALVKRSYGASTRSEKNDGERPS